MAIRLEHLFGNVSGKVGKVIIYQRNGKLCYRSKPEASNLPPSDKQRYQRKSFAKASAFLAPLRSELEFGFSGIPGENSTRFGKALSLAIKCAVLPEEGEPVLYPDRIFTSVGDLLGPADCTLTWETPNSLLIQWRPNSFEGNGVDADRAFYVAYDPQNQRKWSIRETGFRKSGKLLVEFPWSGPLQGRFYHFFSFYSKRKNGMEFSDSLSLGLY